jgi:hypothetical protein
MEKRIALIVKFIVSLFANLNGSSFVGIKGYTNSKGETANHVIIADFSYGNAVDHDLKQLQNATDSDIEAIASKGFTTDLVKFCITKLADAFIKNKDKETQSAQSKGQEDAYIKVTNSIKYHIASGKLFIYALGHSKEVLVEGEYKPVNSSEQTLCQNAIKKYFGFKTIKYKSFEIDPDKLCGVNISGDKITLKS